DVRSSTASALKLSCPSAEVLDSPMPSDSTGNPFIDADGEWSDEEQLLPRNRRKTQYIPPARKPQTATVVVAARESWGQSTSSSDSSTPNGNSPISANGSPLVPPPKSPSRPGSTQEDLVQRFYQVTRERDALRKELQRRSVGPHGIPVRESVVYKSDEKALIEGLHALRYEIRAWTEDNFGGPPSKRSKRPHLHSAKDLFGGLSDNYGAYLRHHTDRPLLIQAYVWSKLHQRIFNPLNKGSGYVWAGKLGDRKLRPINETLRKAVKNEEQAEQYHKWRAMTVNMLVPQVDGKWRPTFDASPVLKKIAHFCRRIRRKLRPWATQSLRSSKEQLHDIVSAAVALDLKMKSQRAEYRFVTFFGNNVKQFYGYGFYDSEMEDVDDGDYKGSRVELTLAPALERSGNANGHVFEQSFILVKADVSCKRLGRERSKREREKLMGKSKLRSFMSGGNAK
ncbi:hypothetical protein M011DRAFT_396702, partial [Sporormia fimetaria CBS 119925]